MKKLYPVFILVIAVFMFMGYSVFAEALTPFDVDSTDSKSKSTEISVVSTQTEEAIEKEAAKEKEEAEKKKSGDFPMSGEVKTNSLRIRSWPWGPVIGMYDSGAKLTVVGESGEFYEVEINGQRGFMHKNYVSTEKQAASLATPYYPGNTYSGGYLSKDEGIAKSEEGLKNKGSSPINWGTWGAGSTDSAALANYKGGRLPADQFIALFGPVARDSMKVTGVPASVTLAQAILETGWGASSIGDAKNLFGIKGTGPAGTTRVSTKEHYGAGFVSIQDNFRKYHSWQQSIDDHARLLQNSRYSGALNAYKSNKDANQYAHGIHKAGYATDPGYANKLISLMKTHNLYKWDV
jgi:flagellum-specific peptidoglycan hydrolase FlgJ